MILTKIAGKKKKKLEEEEPIEPQPEPERPPQPQPTEEERKEAASDFIRKREKAESAGATKQEAFNIAREQTEGVSYKQVGIGERAKTEEKIKKELGLIKEELPPGMYSGEVSGFDLSLAGSKIAEIADIIRVGITGKAPIKTQIAKDSLNEVMTGLSASVNKIQTGERSLQDVKTELAYAENALSYLESSQKGLGQLNLRYWIDDGMNTEIEIAIKKQALEDLKVQLIESAIAAGYR